MDFTIKTYHKLLEALIAQGYAFQTFAEFLEKPAKRSIILRHDVEARYDNALVLATIQNEQNVKGTYFFRFLPDHFDIEIIRKISLLGHEIGYHYDDLSYCKGDYTKALRRFEKNLATLRKIAPVTTICMEGAPLSKYDNRDLWGKHLIPSTIRQLADQTNSKNQISKSQEPVTRNPHPASPDPHDNGTVHRSPLTAHYSDFGILGEPYFDLDFSRVLYLTDTGRRWDGEKVSVRDKVVSRQSAVFGRQSSVGSRQSAVGEQGAKLITPNSKTLTQNSRLKTQNLKFHSTSDIIKASPLLPDQIMFTFHPQRWTDEPLPWLKELVMQNVKNVVKRIMMRCISPKQGDKVVR